MIRFSDYRRKMERAAAAWFKGRGLPVQQRRAYILREWKDWPNNLIDPALAVVVQREKQRRRSLNEGFPLHKYLHHGLSSQAMLFNLVLPLLDDLDALADAFSDAGAPWPVAGAVGRLEVEDRDVFNEVKGQPTSFDLCIEGDAGPPLFIEAKLVEQEFGGCSVFDGGDCDGTNPAGGPDVCPLHRWGRTYWTKLDEFGFLSGDMASSPVCLLGPYYQFFREVIYALSKGGHYVLLVHGDNPAFQRPDKDGHGLWPTLSRFVPDRYRCRLHRVTLQSAADAVEATNRHRDWIYDFQQRYALVPEPTAVEMDVDADQVLSTLPASTSQEIRHLWVTRVRGGRARGDGTGRAAQQRISCRRARFLAVTRASCSAA